MDIMEQVDCTDSRGCLTWEKEDCDEYEDEDEDRIDVDDDDTGGETDANRNDGRPRFTLRSGEWSRDWVESGGDGC
jgi:hypothetical protein